MARLGGLLSKIQGGSFSLGFRSGGIAKLFSSALGASWFRRGASAYLAGGVTSKLAGGSFSGGGKLGLQGWLFNSGGILAIGQAIAFAGGAIWAAWHGQQSMSEYCRANQSSCNLWILSNPPENAYDPDGPKAPGKPPAEVGFEDPKGGENWVRNPNGRGFGWEADDGRVWVPTGHGGSAHGGPHWDVQTPGRPRDYENVRPPKNSESLKVY